MTEKITLLALPGLLCDRAVWQPVADVLGDAVDVIVPDWGTIDSLSGMAEHALATTGAQRFALAGHSMGGRVALEVMRKAPERIERLALLDTGYKALTADVAGERERATRLGLVEIAKQSGMRAMGVEWARPMVHPTRVKTSLFEQILQMIERRTPEVFAAQQRALLARPDATSLLSAIRCPTTIIVGREDGWSPVPQHEEMHAAIAGSTLHVVEQCGHMLPMEQPKVLAKLFHSWLTAPVHS